MGLNWINNNIVWKCHCSTLLKTTLQSCYGLYSTHTHTNTHTHTHIMGINWVKRISSVMELFVELWNLRSLVMSSSLYKGEVQWKNRKCVERCFVEAEVSHLSFPPCFLSFLCFICHFCVIFWIWMAKKSIYIFSSPIKNKPCNLFL